MKTLLSTLLVLLIGTMVSCEKDKDNKDEINSELILKSSAADFLDAKSNISPENSDPFKINSIVSEGNQVKISVSYSGGCSPHVFEIIWDQEVANTNPPVLNMVILHDANGDNCEAYITEELVFELDELVGTATLPGSGMGVYSGFDHSDSAVYDGNKMDVIFTESDVCNMTVTASNAICGWGLYGSTWFALNDSISGGTTDFYFKKYLQPVSVANHLTGFRPVAGKKYSIGARYDYSTTPDPSIVTCLAYPGPSVPVKIMCITELE